MQRLAFGCEMLTLEESESEEAAVSKKNLGICVFQRNGEGVLLLITPETHIL